MNKGKKVGAIILAAGSGQRMGGIEKILAPLGGKPLLTWSADTCEQCDLVEQIVIVMNEKHWELGQKLKNERGWRKVTLCLGGARRQDSVRAGVSCLKECDWVIVHDAARPFLTSKLVEDGLKMALETGAAVAAIPVKDTIKLVEDSGVVKETPPRDKLWASQTPQVFRFDLLIQAYKELEDEVTDDSAALERLGYKVKLYIGDYNNIKVTTPEDLALAEIIARNI
ncbi:MAG: 2-C-methyl-D-erythritol 4-phosphate cytidylyltransferase [Chloroflexota bacterium]|nr:2-C-methyl-D-erythritol 4-phosphate cytidylyltransferase [Chloroflexota bacterium]